MEKIFLGINFGYDAGITILDKDNIYTALTERINYHKQSAEINFSILNAVLNSGNFKENHLDQKMSL